MKDLLLLIVIVVVGYLGYQLIIEDKSLGQVKREIKEQVSDSKVYLAEKYLKQKISESKPYKKGDFSYRSIKCFDDRTYDISCEIIKFSPNTEKTKGNSITFDLTLFGIGSVMEHKVGLFDLNKANIGIKIDNISTDIFDSDKKLKKIEKHFTDMSAEVYLTSSKYGKHELNFAVQGNYDLSFSSSIEVSKNDKSEKIIEQFSECLGELDCNDFEKEFDAEQLAAHLYFEELKSEIKVTKEFLETALSKFERDLILQQIEYDDDIPAAYKKTLRQFFAGERSHSEDRISAKREISFLEIFKAIKDDNESFFENKFNYEIDGRAYNPWKKISYSQNKDNAKNDRVQRVLQSIEDKSTIELESSGGQLILESSQ